MKLVGLMPVRNEDWVLGLSARVALQWCDALVIGSHSCVDRSRAICEELQREHPGRLAVLDFHGEWDEMKHRQQLLQRARAHNHPSHVRDATHIAMIDADEVLTANLLEMQPASFGEWHGDLDQHFDCNLKRMRHYVRELAPGQMLELPGYNLRGALDRYHSNGIWGQRWFSVAFKDTPEAHWAGDKFHSRNPSGVKWQNWRPIQQGEGGVMHLWGASERRLKTKHALYKVTERLRWPAKSTVEINRMYNLWRSKDDELISYPKQWPNDWEYATVPDGWWHAKLPCNLRGENTHVALDGEPWQEAEVRRLVAEHGKETFQGLDLFGVA